MTALVAAELLKFRTTRAGIGYVVATALLTLVAAAGTVGAAETSQLGTVDLSRDILSATGLAEIIAFVIGVVVMTGEWRHGTVTRTFLATPRRGRVLVSKEAFVSLLGAAFAVFALLLALAVAVPWLAVEGSSFAFEGELAGYVARLVLATMLWGGLGVGVGAVIHSQTPALVGAVLWVLLGEALASALLGLVELDAVGEYLPGRALSALDESAEDGLSTWAGGAVALGWVVGLGVLGHLRIAREDVT